MHYNYFALSFLLFLAVPMLTEDILSFSTLGLELTTLLLSLSHSRSIPRVKHCKNVYLLYLNWLTKSHQTVNKWHWYSQGKLSSKTIRPFPQFKSNNGWVEITARHYKSPGQLHRVAQIRRLKEEGILTPKLIRQLSQAQTHVISAICADKM